MQGGEAYVEDTKEVKSGLGAGEYDSYRVASEMLSK